MKKFTLAVAAAIFLTGCTSNAKLTEEERLQRQCFDDGGVYYEYESTSVGHHLWCITPDGADIGPLVSEGDD